MSLDIDQKETELTIKAIKMLSRSLMDQLGEVLEPPGGIISKKALRSTMEDLELVSKIQDKLIYHHLDIVMPPE